MQSILRFTRFAVGLALAGLFVFSQRSDSGAPRGGSAQDARATALVVVRALERLHEDCGAARLAKRLPADLAALTGDGTAPLRGPSPTDGWHRLLRGNAFALEGWSGPYLDAFPADPWGHAFVVTTAGFTDRRKRVWVLSAGPNGRLETTARDTNPHGDDVGLVASW
ncbi:MAG: type II secretion system protein GspG [Planctomycetota bacterium JB042]